MNPSKIAVVTGGMGFIGSHMVDLLLNKKFTVRVIDNLSGGHVSNLTHHENNNRLEIFVEDIRNLNPDTKIFSGADYVFHFAGIGDIVPSIEKPTEYMDVNVQGTVRVLECSRHSSVKKFVYAASSSCYGMAKVPTDEHHPIDTKYPYALSKYLGEQSVFHWNKLYGLPVNSICIFNAYGPRVRTTGVYGAVFGVFFKQKLEGRPFTVVGDGSQARDFIYVTDIAEAFYAAAVSPISGERFNVGAANPQSINKLVEIIGGDVVYVPKRPGEPDKTYADITKIKKYLDWKPNVGFEDGVRIMLNDIEKWENAPLWEPGSIAEATAQWFRYLGNN